jgi:hypothetical protein
VYAPHDLPLYSIPGGKLMYQLAAAEVAGAKYAVVALGIANPFLFDNLRSLLLHWGCTEGANAGWAQPAKGWHTSPGVSTVRPGGVLAGLRFWLYACTFCTHKPAPLCCAVPECAVQQPAARFRPLSAVLLPARLPCSPPARLPGRRCWAPMRPSCAASPWWMWLATAWSCKSPWRVGRQPELERHFSPRICLH